MMKKILALLLALTLVFALAACGDSDSKKDGDDGKDETETAMIKNDSSLPGMSFTAPDGYTAVERMLDKTAGGDLTEKNLKFYYDKDATINLAYAQSQGKKLSDLLSLDGLESVDCDGVSFYLKDETEGIMAIAQKDDVFYGIEYMRPEGDTDDRQMLDDVLKSIKFDGSESIVENLEPEILGNINYTLDPAQNVVATYSDVKEDLEGNLMEKSMTWRIGTDADNVDYRFLIRFSKDAKLDDVLNKDNTYEDAKVGDITYKVRKDSDGNIFEYYTQYGDDVYSIKNLGDGGWFNSRTDESYTAFDALIKSVTFK